eukprot:796728-Prymnesium_polylepis.1
MLTKLVMKGSRLSAGEVLGALVMSIGMAITVLAKLQASASSSGDKGSLSMAAAMLTAGLFVLGVQK